MASESPILIACPPRCGGSMVAGLLHKHGAWIGKANSTRYPGTNTPLGTENQDIKAVLKETMNLNGYKGWRQFPLPESPEAQSSLKNDILGCVDTDGPWLIKTARLLWFWEMFVEMFPEARWVFPMRPIDDVIASIKRHPGLGRKLDRRASLRDIVEEHFCRQSQVAQTGVKFLFVDCDALAMGDLNEARLVVEFAEMEFSKQKTIDWINPDMWHGGAA